MANHPDPSQHPEHPDDSHKTPPPAELNLSGSDDLHDKERTPSDSFIDLGIPGGPADPFASGSSADVHDPSDISIVEWAALVEEVSSDSASSSPKFDNPSDQDWAAKALPQTKHEPVALNRPSTDHAVDLTDLFADPVDVTADVTAKDKVPVEPPPHHEPLPSVPVLTDEGTDEQDSLAADLEVVRKTFNLDELDSRKNLTPPPGGTEVLPPVSLAPEEEDVFEEVDLSNRPGGSGSFSSSGVDLKQLDSNSFEDMVDEIAAEAAGSKSSVDLGSAELPAARKSVQSDDSLDQPPSGRDLIAEAVESGVDMRQPLMEIAQEETIREEEALEAQEVVESSGSMKQPLMDIVEEEALEATEVVESSDSMKQPLMEIVEEEEALEPNEVVESSATMKQPLLEIVEEQEALEASEVVEESAEAEKEPMPEVVDEAVMVEETVAPAAEEPSSAVNLGKAAATETLSREEMDLLLASQEMGTAAEQPLVAADMSEVPLEKPDSPRKTVVAGRHPIRATQMQDINFDDDEVPGSAAVVEEVTAAPRQTAAIEEVTAAPPVSDAGQLVEQEIAAEGGEVVEDMVVEEVAAAAPESGEMVVEETARPVEEPSSEVPLGAGTDYGEDVSEIVLQSNHPTLDSSAHMEELAETGSGVLLDRLKGKKKAAEIDPEEVQLGVSAPADEMDEEAATTKAEEAEGLPEKPKKQRSGALAFVGGGFLGTLVGAGACVALYLSGLVGHPAATAPNTQPKTNNTQPPPQQQVATFDSKLADVRNGNLDRAEKDGIEKIDEAKPGELAARGEFRLLKYLNTQAKANAAPVKVNKEDPLVAGAVADLTKAAESADDKAAAADALFHLAQINELAGDEQGARKAYQDGAAKFKDDPKLKRIFEAALNRLNSRGPALPQMGRLFDPQRPLEEQAFALAMLICLQAPMQGDDTDDEAGFAFWDAVKKARAQQFTDALKALDEARKLHDKRRFLNLRKAQNPLSDPTEEIFLRACDELKAYWAIQDKLRGGGYLTAKQPDAAKAVDAALTLVADTRMALQKQEDLNKKLTADKQTADTTITALNKTVMDQKTNLDTLDKELKAVKEKAAADLTAANDQAAKLKADLKAESDATKSIKAQLVAAKFIDDKADGPRTLEGLKEAIAMAKMSDPQGQIRKLNNDLSEARATLKERWEPKDMLSIWLAVLEAHPSKDIADKALVDANRVLLGAKSTPQEKAQAQALKGLDLRNQDKFVEAKAALEEATKGLGEGSPWLKPVNEALKEVSNPTATYLARVDSLQAKGDYTAALVALTKTLESLPVGQRGELLAERSLLRLEALRAMKKGPLTADDLKDAQDDAKVAAAAGVAQGFYAQGRIAEELRQWVAAADAYQAALDKSPGPLTAANSRYRVSLARVLLQAQGQPAPVKDNKTSRLPALDTDPRQALAALVTLLLQAPLLPPANQEKALKLADEVLNAPPGTVPFDVRAQAFAIKGLYTEALKTYAAGLRSQLRPEMADELMRLIEMHPGLRRPESMSVRNPLNAENHYGAGLRWYYDRNYANAEKEFLEAIRNDPNDARYFYFLGLSRLAQSNRDALEDFAQGARLELQERPARAAVSTALERVQGPAREELNQVRRSITLPKEK